MKAKDSRDPKIEMTEAILNALGREDGAGGYEVSEAYAAPERRRLQGVWTVVEHRVLGAGCEEDYLESFGTRSLKGRSLRDASYDSSYSFSPGICVKHQAVEGRIDLGEGEAAYAWRIGAALAWEVGPCGTLRVRPALAYMATFLDGAPTAMRELPPEAGAFVIHYRFEGEDLVLEEEGERKRLRRTR
jgi:hypothetical protein